MQKCAVVSGASRGFGRAACDELAEHGWDVIALIRDPAGSPAGRSGIQVVRYDVREGVPSELDAAIDERAVTALINNAVQGAPPAALAEVDVATVLNSFDVNVAGPLRLVQALLPALRRAQGATIVNVSSRLGSISLQARGEFAGFSTSVAYKVSKAAQNMLTVALAQELRGEVRCLAVHPGTLATETGRSGSSKLPRVAAAELRELLESADMTSPRFCALGSDDLPW